MNKATISYVQSAKIYFFPLKLIIFITFRKSGLGVTDEQSKKYFVAPYTKDVQTYLSYTNEYKNKTGMIMSIYLTNIAHQNQTN